MDFNFYTDHQDLYSQCVTSGENCGIDIKLTRDITVPARSVDFKIIHDIVIINQQKNTGFDIMVRSSIGKKRLMLMNGVGLIDPGYTGNIIACVVNMTDENVELKRGDSIIQVVHHTRKNNVTAQILSMSEMTLITSRGSAGFGSTGN